MDFWSLVALGSDAEVKKYLGTKYGPRWQDRIAAIRELADRGFGRPPMQALEVEDGASVAVVDAEMMKLLTTADLEVLATVQDKLSKAVTGELRTGR